MVVQDALGVRALRVCQEEGSPCALTRSEFIVAIIPLQRLLFDPRHSKVDRPMLPRLTTKCHQTFAVGWTAELNRRPKMGPDSQKLRCRTSPRFSVQLPMTVTALEILKTVFGYDAFRGPQGRIIEHVIAGNNTLVLMPTGGGKSLCYQIPAIVRPDMGLVARGCWR